MATNYDIDYNDSRFTKVESDKSEALSDLEKTYAGMIDKSDSFYQAQIDASKEWADRQEQLQQEKTDFAIEKIEQQKAQAKKDYIKEQSGAYVDWQKQSNQYGANAEQMAASGLAGSGYSESSQVSMYNTYQNRVTTAREAYNQAVLNYNNSITEARLQNNSILAEIAYNALQQQLELSLQGFQYKNQLITDLTDKKLTVDNMYYNRYQDVLAQINHENALAEQVRQYNESLAEERRQHNENLALQQAKLAEEQRQFNESLAWQKAKEAAEKKSAKLIDSDGVGGGGGYSGGENRTSRGDDSEKVKASAGESKATTSEKKVTNAHADSWVTIPGHGRFSWSEVYAYVKDGTIEEIVSGNNITYRWVGKKTSYNVTPDAKGYAATQKNIVNQFN